MHTHAENTKDHETAFKKALVIAFFFMSLEIIGGVLANSLALITDALHLFTDVGALLLALIIVRIVKLPKSYTMSFGYQRAEVLGALASALSILILCGFLVYESIMRFINPTQVSGAIVFIIAIAGLLANFWMIRILHPVQKNDLNTKAAYLHVLGDLLASIAVVVAGFLIWFTGWNVLDPIVTMIVSAMLCMSSGKIISAAVKILMQSAPEGLDPQEVEQTMLAVQGVKEVHDLHLWSVSSKQVALSAHLVALSPQEALKEVHRVIEEKYHIHYMTIQVEDPGKLESKFCYDAE